MLPLSARERKNQSNREYYVRNKDRILAKQREHYAENRERIIAQKSEYQSRPETKFRRKLRWCGVSHPESVSV